MAKSCAPLIVAVIVLLLPLLYVGSYLALADPAVQFITRVPANGRTPTDADNDLSIEPNYRLGGKFAVLVYWPLEIAHRQLRPADWDVWDIGGPGSVSGYEGGRSLILSDPYSEPTEAQDSAETES